MNTSLRKADIVRAVQDLSDDATLDDAIGRLILLRKVEVGLGQAERGESRPLADVVADRRRKARG